MAEEPLNGRVKMANGKHIAVVGAGSAGLTAAKQVLEEGHSVTIYERTDFIGGLWHYHDEDVDGIASVMQSTIINTSKEISAFSDFPPPAEYPNYMHNSKMQEYFERYADAFDLRRHIKFQHSVEKCELADDYDETGRWRVTVKNLTTNQESSQVFDGVMVATGHHVTPIVPTFPGQEKFRGKIMHSHSYKKPTGFEGKRSVVVGIGNSGGDLAVEFSHICSQTYLSTRRGVWLSYRVGPNGWPIDSVMLSRWFTTFLSWLPYDWRCSLLEKKLNERFDHAMYRLKPKHRVLAQHVTVNDALPNRILAGTCIVKGDIKEFTEDGVIFEGDEGQVTPVDIVVLATGYRINFPFIDKSLVPVTEDNRVYFYKNCFQPTLKHAHTLAIIGLIQPLGPIFPIAELQSRWFALLMSGKLKLPSTEEMKADVERKHKELESRYYGGTRHTIQVDWVPFMDELAEIIGAKPRVWKYLLTDPKLWYALVFGPCVPYQYRLEGPHPWPGAREAILKTQERIMAPLATRKLQ